jgi:lysophospholipase L1-like esterase
MHRRRLLFCALSFLAFVGTAVQFATSAEPLDPKRWEEVIQRFEAQDQKKMPAPDGVLFVGSSSIVRWKLDEAFPDLNAINRGFGGSEVVDSLHFADRIILPYRPRTIVFYAGDNDIANGKSAKQVADDFAQLAAKIHKALPEARVLFLAIKPSRSRWELVEVQREANRLIAAQAEGSDFLEFVDVASPLLGKDGLPREDLFEDDKLHINAAAYEVWNALLRDKLGPK